MGSRGRGPWRTAVKLIGPEEKEQSKKVGWLLAHNRSSDSHEGASVFLVREMKERIVGEANAGWWCEELELAFGGGPTACPADVPLLCAALALSGRGVIPGPPGFAHGG